MLPFLPGRGRRRLKGFFGRILFCCSKRSPLLNLSLKGHYAKKKPRKKRESRKANKNRKICPHDIDEKKNISSEQGGGKSGQLLFYRAFFIFFQRLFRDSIVRAPWFKSVIWTSSSSSSSAVPITGDASWAGMGMGCVCLLRVMFVFAPSSQARGAGPENHCGPCRPHSSSKSGM